MREGLDVALESAAASAVMAFGHHAQKVKAMEECAELIQVLAKNVNSNPHVQLEQIIDEIADVFIVAHSMRQLFGACEVDARIRYKLERLMDAVDRENKK